MKYSKMSMLISVLKDDLQKRDALVETHVL